MEVRVYLSASRHTSRGRSDIPLCDRESVCVARYHVILYLLSYPPEMRECRRRRRRRRRRFRNFGCCPLPTTALPGPSSSPLPPLLRGSDDFRCEPGTWRRNFLTLAKEGEPPSRSFLSLSLSLSLSLCVYLPLSSASPASSVRGARSSDR